MKSFVPYITLSLLCFGTASGVRANETSAVGFGPNAPARHPVVNLDLLQSINPFKPLEACGFLIPPSGTDDRTGEARYPGSFYVYRETSCTSNTRNAVHGERLLYGGMTFTEFKKKTPQQQAEIARSVFDKSTKVVLQDVQPGYIAAVSLQVKDINSGANDLAPNTPEILYAAYHLPDFGKKMEVAVGEINGTPENGFKLLSLCQVSGPKRSSKYSKSCVVEASKDGALLIRMRKHTPQELMAIDDGIVRK